MSLMLAGNMHKVLSFDQYVAGFERLRAYTEKHGLRVAPNSRVGLYGKALERLRHQKRPSGPESHVTHQALLELDQLVAIVDVLGDDPILLPQFQKLVGGPVTTLFAPERDPARDFQFEFYLAAALRRAGFQAHLAEPDVIVNVHGVDLALAAKRPRSVAGIDDLVRKGCHQIQRSKVPGFVVLDMTLSGFTDGLLLSTMVNSVEGLPFAAEQFLMTFIKRELKTLLEALGDKRSSEYVLGYVLYTSLMIQVTEPWQMATARAWQVICTRPPGSLHEPVVALSQGLFREARSAHQALVAADRSSTGSE